MGVLSDGKTKLELFVESEHEMIDNIIAQHPVQRGQPMIDHTQRESKTWDFEGKIMAGNQHLVDNKFTQLLTWQEQGVILSYNGAIHHPNLIISHLEKTYDEGGYSNAVKFSISLTNIRIANTSFVKAKHVGAKAPTKPKSPGKYVTVVAGNTYWGWWQKYGTPIQTLRNWNKWPDRRIPIGVKARVA
ncbi:LysM peptidoglycan-binding domain-containing protein [Loigolactobacillus bifermentans]|uniref:Uncharacterized protein n=1 Tax=Loigolactobacillus bifermentans DSM 20003 TaxID=1423726 RepID=A0A0R1H478_9LACO|nr:LysM peptidoglycan-binding domain-containing protein [Loigolactobacillus bifermentans]KRK40793.1 hypothetical protein FC07_GL002542 [Loigolactobacillus bifermentans DSM 20003]QGG59546.1 LysM peptidoglycan-binding domain-containing protein [Loigolactobacillus bifermentans]